MMKKLMKKCSESVAVREMKQNTMKYSCTAWIANTNDKSKTNKTLSATSNDSENGEYLDAHMCFLTIGKAVVILEIS